MAFSQKISRLVSLMFDQLATYSSEKVRITLLVMNALMSCVLYYNCCHINKRIFWQLRIPKINIRLGRTTRHNYFHLFKSFSFVFSFGSQLVHLSLWLYYCWQANLVLVLKAFVIRRFQLIYDDWHISKNRFLHF